MTHMVLNECYWLRIEGLAWQAATREQYIKAERGAGFYPKYGDGTATGGFSGRGMQGRITYDDITEEKYGNDPEFLAVAQKSALPPYVRCIDV